jgi:zinc protease
MMGRTRIWLALAIVCAVAAGAGPLSAAEEQVTERVFLVRDKPGTQTYFNMIVLAGCGDEPGGQCQGLAHYLEHLVLTGRNREHADNAVRMFPDAYSNGWTNIRATAYVHTVPASTTSPKAALEQLFAFYAGRLRDFAITDADAARERNVVLQEHDWRVASNPHVRFERGLDRELLPDHPAGQWTIGTRESIARFTLADAQTFHRIWYGVNNAYFVVRGDIAPEDLKAIADRALGGLQSKQLPPRTAANRQPPVEPGRRDLRKADMEVKRASIVYKKLVRMEDTDSYPQRAARLILASYLRSRLPGSPYEALVEKAQLAADTPSISIDRVAPKTVVLRIGAEVAHDANPDALLAAMAKYADGLAEVPLSAPVIARLQKRFADARVNEDEDPALIYNRLVTWLAARSAFKDYHSWPARIAAVTHTDMMQTLRALAAPGKIVTGTLLPGTEEAGK